MATFTPRAGELYVTASAGMEETRAFIHIAISGSRPSEIAAATLVLAEAGDGFRPDNAAVSVCALSEPLRGDGELDGNPPAADCTLRTRATRSADGNWAVELRTFADRWTSGNNFGLVVLPDTTEVGATWRVGLITDESRVVFPSSSSSSSSSTTTTVGRPPNSPPTSADEPTELEPPVNQGEPPGPAAGSGVDVTPTTAGGSPEASGVFRGRSTTRSTVVTLLVLLLVAVGVLLATPLRRRVILPTNIVGTRPRSAVMPLGIVGLLAFPLLFREVIVYKAGVVLIFFVGAIGIHALVNWAGQLSVAHAAVVGLPAFTVLTVSETQRISPIYLLPVAVFVGAAVGALLAIPTLRAKGLQVTLVTIVAGVGIDRFFFTKTWLVGGAGGRVASPPTLGPIDFTTSRSLYPLLVFVVAAAVLAAWVLMHSRLGRAWFWVRANPAAASAFGISVAAHRIGAFAIGGAFGGLAGGLSAMWVQRLTPTAFPPSLSFSYLLIAVLAGSGFLGGVAAATWLLQGGQQFATDLFGTDMGEMLNTILVYGGPLALIGLLNRQRSGLNGLGRSVMRQLRASDLFTRARPEPPRPDAISLTLIAGVFSIAGGFVGIWLAWRHAGETDQLWVQNQELLSGGLGGLGAILVGVGLLIRDQLSRNQSELIHHLETLVTEAGKPSRPARRPLVSAESNAHDPRETSSTPSADGSTSVKRAPRRGASAVSG